MTCKDYELIAATLRESRPGVGYARNLLQWNLIVGRFVGAFTAAHPLFDKERFLAACRGAA